MAGRKMKKAAPDSAALDKMRRMKAIRRRARTSPLSTIDDRLTEIEMIANGSAKPADFRRKTLSIPEIRERHDRSARGEAKKSAKRKESGGHDRREPDSDQNREE